MLKQIAECEVANCPGRIELRVLKRRRHRYKLMQEPRNVLRQKNANAVTRNTVIPYGMTVPLVPDPFFLKPIPPNI